MTRKPQCKTLKIKFPRSPQYTPSSLTEAELTRIERIVKVQFRSYKDRILSNGFSTYEREAAFYALTFWYNPPARINRKFQARALLWKQTDREDAQKYFTSCFNYLLACGRRNGELEEYRETSGSYKVAAGYYD